MWRDWKEMSRGFLLVSFRFMKFVILFIQVSSQASCIYKKLFRVSVLSSAPSSFGLMCVIIKSVGVCVCVCYKPQAPKGGNANRLGCDE